MRPLRADDPIDANTLSQLIACHAQTDDSLECISVTRPLPDGWKATMQRQDNGMILATLCIPGDTIVNRFRSIRTPRLAGPIMFTTMQTDHARAWQWIMTGIAWLHDARDA